MKDKEDENGARRHRENRPYVENTDDPSLHVPGIFYALNMDFLNGVAKAK